MLAPLSVFGAALSGCEAWPSRAELQSLLSAREVTNARGLRLRVVAPDAGERLSYEARVLERGELEVLVGTWHDVFNVLTWLAYPCTKAALNARHVAAALAERHGTDSVKRGNRGRARDALTVLDESGALVVSTDPQVIEDLREFRWERLFWHRRGEFIAHARVYVFGHGLQEKALRPYVGMTAHALPIFTETSFTAESMANEIERVDAVAAQQVLGGRGLATPQALAPLPLLGVPGWWGDNEHQNFYANSAYFRPGRLQVKSRSPRG